MFKCNSHLRVSVPIHFIFRLVIFVLGLTYQHTQKKHQIVNIYYYILTKFLRYNNVVVVISEERRNSERAERYLSRKFVSYCFELYCWLHCHKTLMTWIYVMSVQWKSILLVNIAQQQCYASRSPSTRNNFVCNITYRCINFMELHATTSLPVTIINLLHKIRQYAHRNVYGDTFSHLNTKMNENIWYWQHQQNSMSSSSSNSRSISDDGDNDNSNDSNTGSSSRTVSKPLQQNINPV